MFAKVLLWLKLVFVGENGKGRRTDGVTTVVGDNTNNGGEMTIFLAVWVAGLCFVIIYYCLFGLFLLYLCVVYFFCNK